MLEPIVRLTKHSCLAERVGMLWWATILTLSACGVDVPGSTRPGSFTLEPASVYSPVGGSVILRTTTIVPAPLPAATEAAVVECNNVPLGVGMPMWHDVTGAPPVLEISPSESGRGFRLRFHQGEVGPDGVAVQESELACSQQVGALIECHAEIDGAFLGEPAESKVMCGTPMGTP